MSRRAEIGAGIGLLLTLASGATDAISFIRFGGVFASVMTGNLVLLGVSAGEHDGSLAEHAALTIVGYLIGAVIGVRLCEAKVSARGRLRLRAACLALEIAIWIVVLIAFELTATRPTGALQLELVTLTALAMGLQSTVARAFPRVMSPTTYMTGTITELVTAVVTGERLRDHLQVLAALAGVAIGAGIAMTLLAYTPRFAPAAAIVPLAGALVLASLARPVPEDLIKLPPTTSSGRTGTG